MRALLPCLVLPGGRMLHVVACRVSFLSLRISDHSSHPDFPSEPDFAPLPNGARLGVFMFPVSGFFDWISGFRAGLKAWQGVFVFPMDHHGPVHAPPGFTGLRPYGILASRNKPQAPAQARESLGAEPPLQSPVPDLAGTAPRSNWPRPGAVYLLPNRAHAPATWTRSDCTQPACGPDPATDSTISLKPHVELGMAVSKRLI